MKFIKLNGIYGEGKYASIDDEFYELVSSKSWRVKKEGYVISTFRENGKSKTVYLHRLIMCNPKGFEVDHIDNNKLNNCKSNLRVCSRHENAANKPITFKNTSGYKGVYLHTKAKRWVARIQFKNKMHHLGMFQDAKEAAKTYNNAALRYFGEFARLNLID